MPTLEDYTSGWTTGLQIGANIGRSIAAQRQERERLARLVEQTKFANEITLRDQAIQEAEAARQAQLFQQRQDFATKVQSYLQPDVLDQLRSPEELSKVRGERTSEMMRFAPSDVLPGLLERTMSQQEKIAEQRKQEAANKLYSETLGQGLQSGPMGEPPDILGAVSGALRASPMAEAAQKVDPDALLRAQQAPQLREAAQEFGIKSRRLGQAMSLQNQTGIKTVDDETGEIIPEGMEAARQKKQQLNTLTKTPVVVRAAEAVIDDIETQTGEKLSPSERAQTRSVLITSGNRAPTLDTDTRSRLNVAEYGVDAIDQLIDEIKKHPGVKFGPGTFRLDVATGKWLSGNPEASKIAQLYTQLYAGKAFAQGGKNLTANEIKLIRDQIGDPTDATFGVNLQTAQKNLVQDLGLITRQVQDQQFDIFPRYKQYIERLTGQYNRAVKKYGIAPSSEFAPPRQGGGRLTPAQEQRRQELLRKAGQ